MLTQFDIPEMLEVYSKHDNYEVLDLNPADNRCIIYFSSNGLYYPSNEDVFRAKILKNNRFEWKRNHVTSAGRSIFVRDVTKQWYLDGISKKINTIDALVSFLKLQTKGFQVICVGSSAGGYAASLVGALLNASHVLNFSGQFSLNYILNDEAARSKNPTITKYENIWSYRKYYSIRDFIEFSKMPIFYFYPAYSKSDIVQAQSVEGLRDLYGFPFKSSTHGRTCYLCNLSEIISYSLSDLFTLYSRYGGKPISPFEFSLRISGYRNTLKYLTWELPKLALKKIMD